MNSSWNTPRTWKLFSRRGSKTKAMKLRLLPSRLSLSSFPPSTMRRWSNRLQECWRYWFLRLLSWSSLTKNQESLPLKVWMNSLRLTPSSSSLSSKTSSWSMLRLWRQLASWPTFEAQPLPESSFSAISTTLSWERAPTSRTRWWCHTWTCLPKSTSLLLRNGLTNLLIRSYLRMTSRWVLRSILHRLQMNLETNLCFLCLFPTSLPGYHLLKWSTNMLDSLLLPSSLKTVINPSRENSKTWLHWCFPSSNPKTQGLCMTYWSLWDTWPPSSLLKSR